MITVFWAAKGGSGTTVLSCSVALLSARQHESTLLIDLAGDAPTALGMPDPAGPGIHDWVGGSSAPPSATMAIGVNVTDKLRLIPAGSMVSPSDHPRWLELGEYFAAADAAIVIDAGTRPPPASLMAVAEQRILVTRACYLSLRRAAASQLIPTGVIVVLEPGRALRPIDVAHALNAPVIAEVDIDPAVARAVDAGLLAARLPRSLATSLREFAA